MWGNYIQLTFALCVCNLPQLMASPKIKLQENRKWCQIQPTEIIFKQQWDVMQSTVIWIWSYDYSFFFFCPNCLKVNKTIPSIVSKCHHCGCSIWQGTLVHFHHLQLANCFCQNVTRRSKKLIFKNTQLGGAARWRTLPAPRDPPDMQSKIGVGKERHPNVHMVNKACLLMMADIM